MARARSAQSSSRRTLWRSPCRSAVLRRKAIQRRRPSPTPSQDSLHLGPERFQNAWRGGVEG
eukprot:9503964-Pyramimonas_sp.AAC.2